MTTTAFRRRDVIRLGMAGGALALLAPFPAMAAPEDTDAELAEFARGAEPQEGRITLGIAESVENGSNVPVSVEVDSAMEGDDMVESVILLAEHNPNPVIATFHFSAMSGAAAVSTRVRLAQSQTVTAAARMKDGSVFIDRRPVEVLVGGCVG